MRRRRLLLLGLWWSLEAAAAAVTSVDSTCEYTGYVLEFPIDVTFGQYTDVAEISAGQSQVMIEVDMDSGVYVDMILQDAGGAALLDYGYENGGVSVNWYPNHNSFMHNGMTITSCVDTCSATTTVGPYDDGETYDVTGSGTYTQSYLHVDATSEVLTLKVIAHVNGAGKS